MTAWDVLVILAKRWIVTAAGLAATVGVLAALSSVPGVYASEVNVLFLAPPTQARPNTLDSGSSGVIATAGLVERLVNAGIDKPATASEVTLVGQGIRDGYSLGLPNSGGQWSQNFNKPILRLQVTGPSQQSVATRLEQLVAEVARVTREIQGEAGVRDAKLITTEASPATPQVRYVEGRRKPGLLVAAALGLSLTGLATVYLDRVLSLRRRRRRTSSSTLDSRAG